MKSDRIAIAGVGESAFSRKAHESNLKLMTDAALAAIDDAGLKPQDIDGLINCTRHTGADQIAHELNLPCDGFRAATEIISGAGAMGNSLLLAQMAIEAGIAKRILVVYGIKCSSPGGVSSIHAEESIKADLEMPVGYFGQATYFAAIANRYRYEFGLEEEDLAAIAISNRAWAALNPKAQRRELLNLEGYRRSPMISKPLRAADCCLLTDGAAAYVVTSTEEARSLRSGAVSVAGLGVATTLPLSMVFSQQADLMMMPANRSAAKAFEMAGLTAADVDLAQIYDCFTISQLIQTELLGLAPRGEGARLYRQGMTAPGGRIPINTSGGHLSGAYVPGANLLVEGVRQLRGERGEAQVSNARICAVMGMGANSHATLLLKGDV